MKKCFTIDSYCSKYALCENKFNQFNKTKHAKTSCQQGYFYKHGFLGGALF